MNGQFGSLLGQVEGHPALTMPVQDRLGGLERERSDLQRLLQDLEERGIEKFNRKLDEAGIAGSRRSRPGVPVT